MEWIKVEDEPKAEGKYLCCKIYNWSDPSIFVSNYHFNRWRNTGELVGPDEDGIVGCFEDNMGYAQQVHFWMPLPEPSNQ